MKQILHWNMANEFNVFLHIRLRRCIATIVSMVIGQAGAIATIRWWLWPVENHCFWGWFSISSSAQNWNLIEECLPKNHRSSNWNKLAKLWDAIAISKSETINHSLTHWLTHWQGELLGDAIASNNYQIVSMVEHRAGTIALMECRQTIDSMDKKPSPWKIYWRWIHPYNYYVQCLCNIVQVQYSIEMSGAILALAL